MNASAFITAFIVSAVLSALTISPFSRLLSEKGFNVPNYSGEIVPVGTGLIIILVPVAAASIASIFFPTTFFELLPFLGFLTGIAMLGLIDDFLGDRTVQGFKGHFSEVLNGKLSSGFVKALGSLAFVLLLVRFTSSRSIGIFLIDFSIVLLSINAVNLLDLAPGRALKFCIPSFVLLSITGATFYYALMSLFFPPVIAVFFPDLKAESMMGDVGANLLGALIGLLVIMTLSPQIKIFILLVFLSINLYAEFGSISELISKNSFLKRLDEFGR